MAYARISSVNFAPGKEKEGERLERDLLREIEKQPGYLSGMLMKSVTDPRNVTRITFWNTHRDADNAGGTTHIMALRSRIRVLAEEGGREDEDSLEVIDDGTLTKPAARKPAARKPAAEKPAATKPAAEKAAPKK
jgi:hypothetical protein